MSTSVGPKEARAIEETLAGWGGGGMINVNFHWATGGLGHGGDLHWGGGGGVINVNFCWATGGLGHRRRPMLGGGRHDQCQLPLGHRGHRGDPHWGGAT